MVPHCHIQDAQAAERRRGRKEEFVMDRRRSVLRKSGFRSAANHSELLNFTRNSLGHSCPQGCPPLLDSIIGGDAEALGTPLSIREAAGLIGCSPWTVRQKLIPSGLPVF